METVLRYSSSYVFLLSLAALIMNSIPFTQWLKL